MVVPYINAIEKPKESFIENADKNMTDIITDMNFSDDYKMKMYHKNLSKFLLKYDPETYGVTPALIKLAQTVSEFVDKQNKEENSIPLQIKNEPTTSILTPDFKSEKKEPSSKKKLIFNFDSPLEQKDYGMNNDYYKITDSSINNNDFSKIEQSPDSSLVKNFEKNIEPSKNTRNKKAATHHQGEYGDHLLDDTHITQRKSTLTHRTPLIIKNKQTGRGNAREFRKWKTKKFF